MLAMWAENVLRLAAMDCSSPMSAKIAAERRKRASRLHRNQNAACAMTASRPKAFKATVLPPVFGPEITSARAGGTTVRSDAIGLAGPCSHRRLDAVVLVASLDQIANRSE